MVAVPVEVDLVVVEFLKVAVVEFVDVCHGELVVVVLLDELLPHMIEHFLYVCVVLGTHFKVVYIVLGCLLLCLLLAHCSTFL